MEFYSDEIWAGQRLDAAAAYHNPQTSRAKIQKAIRAGNCQIDGQTTYDPALRLKAGQRISLVLAESSTTLQAAPKDLKILWQDEHMAIIDKPAGLIVHPCPSCTGETLAHHLLAQFPQLTRQGGERPGIVHRLDKDTSGLLAIALTEADRLTLAKAFAARAIKKTYLALVAGIPPENGECLEPVGRHPDKKTRMAIVPEKQGGRPASTSWRRIWHSKSMNVSLLEVSIRTGRTHQIRVHLAHLGWPILGDTVYAPKAIAALAPRQMLHAFKLGMEHPVTRRHMLFTAPPPPDFSSTLLANYRPFTRLVITGNQGCGKSSFCKALASLGLPVISADAVVAELYGKIGEAASWIGEHFGEDMLHKDGSVNKTALFEFIEQKPYMRKELENVVHALVKDRIEGFWQKMQAAGQNMAVAEIPLFFESGLHNQMQNCYAVGISCEKAQRWQRIAQSRHWSQEKIEAIEKWQWPEDRKMSACQQVVSNNGNYDQLAKAASDLIVHINARQNARASELAQLLPQICGVEYSVHLG